ncbi:MAG: PKD domain-containing protein, partial [Nitrospina sp.]|nr:PKD domain-containing protein [Nitrospina sp.]
MKTNYRSFFKKNLINFLLINFIFFIFVSKSFGQASAGDQPTVTETEIITPFDSIPRFCNSPTVVAQSNGLWSDQSIWSTNQVPSSGARVSIPQNIQVTYDANSSEGIDCIEIGAQGELSWAPDQDTLLHVSNLQILPNGTLTIGSDQNPINNQAEVVIQDIPLDVNGRDPRQYGNGIHGFGTVQVKGAPMDRTFIRFASEPLAGQTTLELEQSPLGWLPGDRLIIPDTRQIPFRKNKKYISQAEEPTIQAITGSTVTLNSPLVFDHLGPRDANGNVGPIELGMLPHVGNLSRNVIIRSVRLSETSKSSYCSGPQNVLDASNCVTRGHILLMERAAVDIRYAGLENLGRTTIGSLNNTSIDGSGNVASIGSNQIGRYSIHLHHVMGPVNETNTGNQFTLVGNVIEGMLKWGLAVHDSHYGLVKDNIAYDGQGSAITTEDGNESFNVFERNFVVHTKAGDQEQVLESPKRGGVFSGRKLFGTTRDGFWFSGMNNFLRDNVVANAPDFAYNYNGYYLSQDQPIPNFRGANMETDSTIQTALPVLESARNEAYGATGQGLWATWSKGCCNVGLNKEVSLFEGYRIWHVNHAGAEFFHENGNTLDDFILRNNPSISAQNEGGSLRFNSGFHFANSSYENGKTIFRNIDMQGFNVGIRMPLRPEDGTDEPNITLLENSFLKNYENIRVGLPNIDSMETIIRNVKTEPLNIQGVRGQPSQPTAIRMRYSLSRFTNLVNRSSRTYLYDFNAIPGNNFEVFFEEQAPDFLIPPEPSFNGRLKGCPESGLTNQQCFAKYSVAVASAIAPCIEQDGESSCNSARARATALGILGLVFPIGNTPIPNSLPIASFSPNNLSGNAPFSINFSGASSIDTDGTIVSYDWDFGDGSNASGVQVNHTFQNSGTFVVQLTVTDNDGDVDSALTTVAVTSAVDPASSRITTGLVALYDFNEGTGSTVLDQSGVSPVMNLDIENQSATTTWLPEALSIDSETILQPASTPIEFVDAFKATNEMTIEAWVKPSNASQTGPARLVTFSKDGSNRNFTLGQDGDDYQLRLRQSGSSSNGSPYLSTPNSTTTTNLTHIVVTKAANGDRTFYLDGNQVSSSNVPGDFSNWF